MVQALEMIDLPASRPQETLRHAVWQGLQETPRQLPCRFFYDEMGSHLFERICQLKEYYPTRTERSIICENADAILEAAGNDRIEIVELGSGSSCKTRLLLEAAMRRQSELHYIPIDISGAFLRSSAETLLYDYPELAITAIAAEYRDALTALPPSELPRLFLFLGGNIGNFEYEEAAALLHDLQKQMRPCDRLLVGADQVKDVKVMTAAYNDSEGVTAAFNKNLLHRINHELNADFDTDAWIHSAPFIADRSRIEMWLVSADDQEVRIDGTTYRFRCGEGIHTENSHKYTISSFNTLCHAAGLAVQETWTDRNRWFCLHLIRPMHREDANA